MRTLSTGLTSHTIAAHHGSGRRVRLVLQRIGSRCLCLLARKSLVWLVVRNLGPYT